MRAILIVLVSVIPFLASAQEETPKTPTAGLWESKKRFGPDLRGRLLLIPDAQGWRAEIAGYRATVRRRGDTVSFVLPDQVGEFTGRIARDGGSIAGHWVQFYTYTGGTKYASPVVLTRARDGHYVGDVQPLDDAYTMFLSLKKRSEGVYSAFLRNPERNLGRQLRADVLEVKGDRVTLVGKRNGAGADRALAWGRAGDDDFNLYFPGRGGSYDFKRVEDTTYTDFYPRGRPSATYQYAAPPDVGDGWPVGTLASVDLDTEALSRFVRAIISQSMDSLSAQQVHALLIARHGKLVLEEYFHGDHRDLAHDTRSAAKSVTATLAGAVIHQGTITLKTPVYSVMYDGRLPSDIEPRKKTITLEHFMGMASGIDCDDRDDKSPGGEETILNQEAEPDYYKLALGLKTIRGPGEKAVYCSIQPHFVGGVLSHATHRPLTDLFQDLIARPLGITHYYMNLSPSGAPYMGGGLRLTARDFMKFGQLYLNGGTWKGTRILDADFVRAATEPKYALEGIRYGLYWWVLEYPFRGDTLRAYFAGGNGGQIVMVIPKLDMVIASNGGNYSDAVTFKLQRQDIPTYVLPAVKR
jgi:CubicO group peptidase (beta-lactamase class C family)